MHRLFPKWKIHSYDAIHWRVSRLDGSGMRDVAHFRHDPRPGDSYPFPSWLPGGKKLSFIFRDTLYTLPVD